jgi:hypothetical protein
MSLLHSELGRQWPRLSFGTLGHPRAMKSLIVLLLSCASALSAETFIPLKSGETNLLSYGLACVVGGSDAASNAPAGTDLVLTLRNTGAKWIGMNGVTVADFSLIDSQGKPVKIHLESSPRTMTFGAVSVIHLRVDNAAAAQRPWTLHFKCKSDFVPELTITDIVPRKN